MNKTWTFENTKKIFNMPFPELIYNAQKNHKKHFRSNEIQISTLLSIKTGKCPENCSYCSQSIHHNTNIKSKPLLNIEKIIQKAKEAKQSGSTRFCMGAAWKGLHNKDMNTICNIIKEVKKLNLETCVTLGSLNENQAKKLKEAGLDFYNHNIDTSKEYYNKIVTTRTFEDRIKTLDNIRKANIKICCGGIIGMGESNDDRIKMLVILANMNEPPESIPINMLVKIKGTPFDNIENVDPFDFIRTIATARIIMPKSSIRLSAGRNNMSYELQALCFLAGTNSIFYGEKLLTSKNTPTIKDDILFNKLGLKKIELYS
ncbi:biotin synthase BioB [Candidatus Legionella polyplacis]|uniref:biotin synthase BioB n=1 Tax=Candidatus Legionella polyplacis TaxID=2005262 RepID=UPI000C1E5213|nr:biotin synthase BioB [Candidatus Legionella polyplacis]ATW01823.1 biotin synthase BioB [Candidatus Legionella polyplacis]